MKRLHTHSQHFLRNPRFVHELIGHTSIKRTDTVYDIGAGSGVITSALAQRAKQVIAIEVEPATATLLRKNTARYENVTVIEDDFLSTKLPSEPYKIVANIPFHLSSAILRKISESANPPRAAYLIVQKQFANKLLPDHPGFSSQLGMVLGVRFQFRVRRRLQRTDFWPHPNVDTVFLEILHRDQPLLPPEQWAEYESFITLHFTTPTAFAELPLGAIGKLAGTKPSNLTLAQWLQLFLIVRSRPHQNPTAGDWWG